LEYNESYSDSALKSRIYSENKQQGFTLRKNSLSSSDAVYEVKIRIHYITTIAEELYILGNIEELGSWKDLTCKMEHKGNYVWEAVILLRSHIKSFTYKFVCVNKKTGYWRWESTNDRLFSKPDEDYVIDSAWECIYN